MKILSREPKRISDAILDEIQKIELAGKEAYEIRLSRAEWNKLQGELAYHLKDTKPVVGRFSGLDIRVVDEKSGSLDELARSFSDMVSSRGEPR